MELTTAPKYIDVPVTMVDFMFLGGVQPLSIILEEGDVIDYTNPQSIYFQVKDVKGHIAFFTVERRNLLYLRHFDTVVQRDNPAYAEPKSGTPFARPTVNPILTGGPIKS